MPPRRPTSSSSSSNPILLILRIIRWIFGRSKAVFLSLLLMAVLCVGALGWYLFQPPSRKHEINRYVGNYSQQHKRITVSQFLWDLWTLYIKRPFAQTRVQGGENIIFGGEPQRAGFPYEIRTLYNSAYTVGYCDSLDNPVWAAYRVFDLEKHVKSPPRPEGFFVDTRTSARVEPGDYTGSGYDRGHMAPNYAIGTRFGHDAQEETFKMSNVCPQRHRLNAGLWKELETKIADNYTGRFGQIWVIDGPIFGPFDRLKRIGNNKVPIPDAFYMIIIQQHEDGVRNEAFIMGQDVPAHGQLEPYLTTVSEIERRTGLNFYPKLEKQAQKTLETARESSLW